MPIAQQRWWIFAFNDDNDNSEDYPRRVYHCRLSRYLGYNNPRGDPLHDPGCCKLREKM